MFDIFWVVFFVVLTMAEYVCLNAISHSLLKVDPIFFLELSQKKKELSSVSFGFCLRPNVSN
jgi:hypothetical protein